LGKGAKIMDDKTINGNPTKNFFIKMITKDIDLKDAILELIDNAIDGAKRVRGTDNYKGLFIKISLDRSKFEIEDNCGGIPFDIAQNYAFRFGKEDETKDDIKRHVDFSTGRFGIGMKRALFKMGKKFIIESIEEKYKFRIDIDVDEWMKQKTKEGNDDWNFKFSDINKNEGKLKRSTKITVLDLYEGVSDSFSNSNFINRLKYDINSKISESIEKGISITVADTKIKSEDFEMYFSEKIKPAFSREKHGDVDIIIIAGVSSRGAPDKAGWYVVCNNRFVLVHDQTSQSVWDDVAPKFHPSFAMFRGIVLLSSKDPTQLPWNTTKTGLDLESDIYKFVKLKMSEMTKSVIKFIREIDEIEKFEDLLKNEKKSKLSNIIDKGNSLSQEFKIHYEREIIEMKSVSYKKPKAELDKMKKILEVSSYKDVGLKTYEYYKKNEEIEL
jgi:hypothetical protein